MPGDAAPDSGPGDGESGRALDASIRRILLLNLGLAALASVVSLRFGWPAVWGVLAGGLLMAANFRIITGVIRTVFTQQGRKSWKIALYWLKFTVLLGLISALILWVKVDGVGFVVGMSTFLAAVVIESGLRLFLRH